MDLEGIVECLSFICNLVEKLKVEDKIVHNWGSEVIVKFATLTL